ncbi:carbohydrate ABC transporter permease [Clostridium sp. DL1XJH146]
MLKKIRQNYQLSFMMIPGIVFLTVFTVYPLLWVLRYIFFDYSGFGQAEFVGLHNFIRIFTRDPDYWNAVVNTFQYAFGKLIITVPLSFLLAVLLNIKFRGRNLFRAAIFLPTIMSVSVMSMVFYFIFNSYNGIINQLLMRFNLVSQPVNWLGMEHAMQTVVVVAIWGAIGNYMIYFMAGLQSIPGELYESASIDGASKFKQLIHITVPMMAPVTQMVVMLAIMTALKGFESIMIMTSGGPAGETDVMFLMIYRIFFGTDTNMSTVEYGYGTAVALLTSLIVGVITLIYLQSSKKMKDNH